MKTTVRVIGYGNPGRQDDGLGPALVERVESLKLPGVSAEADYQLNIEDAADLPAYEVVIFADASHDIETPFAFYRVLPGSAMAFTSHSLSPEAVLGLCRDQFGPPPEAWVLAIRGYAFDMAEGLTPEAQTNLEKALSFVQKWIRTWKEKHMTASGVSRKTILAIDDDPDIRAALRIVLEAEGFSVGEAANGEEGLKIAERIKPDAIIVDLMMENVDSGSTVAQKLKASGYAGPVYMLSSAGDTVRYNLDARDLGLAGIFQKPIDPKTLVATLKTKLKDK